MEVESVVRGHHVYKSVWTPVSGEELAVVPEAKNSHDRYAVDVLKDGEVVGHITRELSRTFYFILKHSGEISCVIMGKQKYEVGFKFLVYTK